MSEFQIYGCLYTYRKPRSVADIFAAKEWEIRSSGLQDYAIYCPWAQIEITAGDPPLMSGTLRDWETRFPEVIKILERAKIGYKLEIYDAEENLVAQKTDQK
jgi:hypothetical protein